MSGDGLLDEARRERGDARAERDKWRRAFQELNDKAVALERERDEARADAVGLSGQNTRLRALLNRALDAMDLQHQEAINIEGEFAKKS